MIKIDLDMFPTSFDGKELGENKLSSLLATELANGSDPVNGEKFGDWSDNLSKDNFIEVDEVDYNILIGIVNSSKTFTNLLKNRLLKTLRSCKEKAQ